MQINSLNVAFDEVRATDRKQTSRKTHVNLISVRPICIVWRDLGLGYTIVSERAS